MGSKISTLEQAYKVVDHINARMVIDRPVELAGFSVTKISDRRFVVAGEGVDPHNNKYIGCELAEFIIWPHRRAWSAAIKAANGN